MSNDRKATTMLTDASNDIFKYAMPQAGIPGMTTIMGAVSNTCKYANTLFKDTLVDRKTQKAFFQAVIDDDRETVKHILDSQSEKLLPELLLLEPQHNMIIESQRTWQKFYAENALTMAVKRKQIKMIDLLLSYYDKLIQTKVVEDAKAASLSAWKDYEMQKNAQGKDEIVIPDEYAFYAKSLIDTFTKETFPHGKLSKKNKKLSEETELALSTLLNILLPKKPVELDDYLDIELLLLAVYKTFWDNFDAFKNDNQRDAFCIRVRGLIESVLHPETSEIYCEGLYNVVTAMEQGKEKEIKISALAKEHKLKGGQSFYRASRDSHVGLGYDYFCDIFGAAPLFVCRGWIVFRVSGAWKSYVEQKQQIFGTLRSDCTVSKVCTLRAASN